MSHYKLTYFDLRGRAEIARFIFAAAGQKYEDNRIPSAKWPALKPSTPFGQMPLLEVDGITLCQSGTIARFLANRFGLAGKTDLEKAQVDMIVDCIFDTLASSVAISMEKDESKKAEIREKYGKEILPGFIEKLEKLLVSNKGGDGYFVGDSMTWADLELVTAYTWLDSNGVEPNLGPAPKLEALKKRVEQHPKIAEWIKNRPKSEL